MTRTMGSPHALVLDIGGSHVTSALVDLDKRMIVDSSIHRTHVNPNESSDNLLSAWANATTQALGSTSIRHIGIAMPGPFDYDTGVSRLHHKFASLYGMNVSTGLQEKLNLDTPIYFGNDASLFALGEWWAGAAKGFDRVIGVTLGTGLGGGFVAGGKVYYSGEAVPKDGGIWDLPYLDGITEDYVSGPALVKNYYIKTGATLNPAEIAREARANEAAAIESYLELGSQLGEILKPWVKAFEAQCVVVGGNIARSFDLFEAGLGQTLESSVKLVASELFDKANLFGAAALGVKIQ
jgi:glucokinase